MTIPLVLIGATGRMGGEVRRLLAAEPAAGPNGASIQLVAGFSRETPPADAKTWPADAVVLDVSLPAGTEALVTALEVLPRAAVIATTGLNAALEARIVALGTKAAIFRAKNLSLGVAVMRGWLKALPAPARAAFSADVVEHHHAAKKDAPSGTAIDLAASLGPMGPAGAREPKAPAIQSIRSGTLPGTHRVILSGEGETLEITHTVYDRSVFARGALRAVRFLYGKPPGLYGVDDLVRET